MVSKLEIRKSKETVCCCCGENKKLVELVLIETKSERVLPVLSLCEKCRKNLIATLQMCTKGAIVEPSGDTINVTMNGSNNTVVSEELNSIFYLMRRGHINEKTTTFEKNK